MRITLQCSINIPFVNLCERVFICVSYRKTIKTYDSVFVIFHKETICPWKKLSAILRGDDRLSIHSFFILNNWAPIVSSSIPSWQILTAHAQPFRGARDLAFCLKVPLDSLLVWASSETSGETARMRRLAWTFAARIGDKYQIRLTRFNW